MILSPGFSSENFIYQNNTILFVDLQQICDMFLRMSLPDGYCYKHAIPGCKQCKFDQQFDDMFFVVAIVLSIGIALVIKQCL